MDCGGELANTLYVANHGDNVATALGEVAPGEARLIGDITGTLPVREAIMFGHKAALRPIQKDGSIIKYGASIAHALRDIGAGEYVHIHNAASNHDIRTSGFDEKTGVPTDRPYELP